MKRYIRLKSGKIFDIINQKQEIEHLQNLHPTEDIDNFLDKQNIIVESDDILDLIQTGDLISGYCSTSLQLVDEGLVDLIWDRKENYGVKKPEDLSIYNIYTKQEDDYILVWDKERGVI